MTHVCADWEWPGVDVHRTCRTQSNRRRTFKQNPRVTHSVDIVTNLSKSENPEREV